MNTDDQNLEKKIQIDPEDRSRQAAQQQEMVEIEQIGNDLMNHSYEQLAQKYSELKLNSIIAAKRPASNTNVIDYILLLRQLLVITFTPPEKMQNIDNKAKEKIVFFFAGLDPRTPREQTLAGLQAINPDLALPEKFDPTANQLQARQLYNATQNIKKIIAHTIAPTYLTDVMHLYRLPDEKLKNLSEQLISISEKLQGEYGKLIKEEEPDLAVLDEAINFLAQTGRTPLAIKDLQSSKNLGDVTDLILQITTAMRVVNILKSKNLGPNISEETALAEIKADILGQLTI